MRRGHVTAEYTVFMSGQNQSTLGRGKRERIGKAHIHHRGHSVRKGVDCSFYAYVFSDAFLLVGRNDAEMR